MVISLLTRAFVGSGGGHGDPAHVARDDDVPTTPERLRIVLARVRGA
ncbi:hypothetical protein HUT06_06740 [Actinomadura sp. NAK00032]|nr:hypothetical protein [Actinomadura sp. NAK00032]QKW33767.1 hypothetical protein HUT06_06740 [Actinomadura sp. NAK00032]